jgi:predicted nucleotidyltransferase
VVTDERQREYTDVCNAVVTWASQRRDIEGVAVVGSWARSEPRMDSDIDLVILTTQKAAYTVREDWVSVAVSQPAELIRTQEWGPLTERRIRVKSGLEIDFGFATPNWAETDPMDPGTAGVVSNGCTPILDRGELFKKLIDTVSARPI